MLGSRLWPTYLQLIPHVTDFRDPSWILNPWTPWAWVLAVWRGVCVWGWLGSHSPRGEWEELSEFRPLERGPSPTCIYSLPVLFNKELFNCVSPRLSPSRLPWYTYFLNPASHTPFNLGQFLSRFHWCKLAYILWDTNTGEKVNLTFQSGFSRYFQMFLRSGWESRWLSQTRAESRWEMEQRSTRFRDSSS